jgi:hypothetical protein
MRISPGTVRRIIREALEISVQEKDLFDSFDKIFGEVANELNSSLKPAGYYSSKGEPYYGIKVYTLQENYWGVSSTYWCGKDASQSEEYWCEKFSSKFEDILNNRLVTSGFFSMEDDPLNPDNFRISLDDDPIVHAVAPGLNRSESAFDRIRAIMTKFREDGHALTKDYVREVSIPRSPKSYGDAIVVTPQGTTKQVKLISASDLDKLKSSNPDLAGKVSRFKSLSPADQTDVMKRVRAAFPSPELTDK